MTELRRDGLLAANAKSFSLQWRDEKLTVNGQLQSDALAAKYAKLLGLTLKPGQTYNMTVNNE